MILCNHDDLHLRLCTISVRQLANDLFVGALDIPPGIRCGPRGQAHLMLEECIQCAWDHDYQITQVTLDDETDEDCLAVLRGYGLIPESPLNPE